MATRGRDADDMIASLMQEMGQKQGYQNYSTPTGENLEDEDNGGLSYYQEQQHTSHQRRVQELSDYPDNTYKAGSQSIWNPIASGASHHTKIARDDESKGLPLFSSSPFLLPTNPRIEIMRRRVFEKFRQEVHTLLQEFQTKHLSFASSVSSGDSSSFSKNKNKLPIPSMIDKWHLDAKLEERNFLLKKKLHETSTASRNREDDAYRSASLSSTADILRERVWRKEHGQPIYDPILLNKQAPGIFVETILTPHVQKLWQQMEHGTNQNSPLPPKFSKRAQQVQKGLYRFLCEAIDSFESQLLQGAREEALRSTATGKNRKSKNYSNKRPKITCDDSSSIVRVTFSGVSLKLHRAYLEKLERLHDRTRERRRRKEFGCVSDSYHNLSFEEALFCLLCRYDMIQGAGLQAGVPGAIMDVLLERFDCRMECFASPFNCRYDRFASAFADVDAPFGSNGSFFELPILSRIDGDGSRNDDDSSNSDDAVSRSSFGGGICYQANPPFCDGLILQLDDKITRVLSSKVSQRPIMFVVFVPAWRDSECYKALLANSCLTKHLLLKQGEHWYAEGTQHRRKDSFRVASFDTSILFYQNESAKNLWKLQEDDNPVFRELKTAFGQDPGSMQKMQKEQNSLEIPSNGTSRAKQTTKILTVSADEVGLGCEISLAKDRKKLASSVALSRPKKETKNKPKKVTKGKKREWNQLALLESLGLSSASVQGTVSVAHKSKTIGTASTKKKRRKK